MPPSSLKYFLWIHRYQLTSSSSLSSVPSENTVEIPLPFFLNSVNQCKRKHSEDDWPTYAPKPIPLCDINVGKLLYFSQGCTVFLKGSKNVECPADDMSSSPVDFIATLTSEEKREEASEVLHKWCLVHYPFEAVPSMDSTIPPLGTVSTRNKALVCRVCGKSFPSLRGVQHHIRSVHAIPPSASEDDKEFSEMDNKDSNVTAQDMSLYLQPLHVLYQDAYLAIVNKPQGMTVMGGRPSLMRSDLLMALVCTDDEKEQVLRDNMKDSSRPDKPLGKPRPVHRLDNATGGLLVIAKTHNADQSVRVSFMNRLCHKRYRAVLHGKLVLSKTDSLPPHVTLVESVDHDAVIDANVDGKASQTNLRIVRHIHTLGNWFTLVDLWPVTGRTHQLRKHMKLIGFSIYGDTRYISFPILSGEASRKVVKPTLCLWAVEITLPHPHTGQITTFQIPKEEDLSESYTFL